MKARILILALVACTPAPQPVPDHWVTFVDEENRIEVSHPPDWVRAHENLTPNLLDPREVLSIGSFRLRPSGPGCAQIPTHALIDMTPEDAFLTLQGGLSQPPADDRTVFGSLSGVGMGQLEFPLCLPEGERSDIGEMRWIQFSDSERGFYLLVAIGSEASPETRDQIWDVANSLVIHHDE